MIAPINATDWQRLYAHAVRYAEHDHDAPPLSPEETSYWIAQFDYLRDLIDQRLARRPPGAPT